MTTEQRPGWSTLCALGWAVYLACSWTWCIGMFFPVLLVHDYGVWGFVIFAVPNVLGAAALGWIIRDGSRVKSLIARHAGSMRVFSWVTILFHVAFLATFGQSFGVGPFSLLLLPVVAALGWLSAGRSTRWARFVGVAVYLLSAVLMTSQLLALPGLGHLPAPRRPDSGVLWLAPICAFGFLLCPYLDLTFLRARSSTERSEARVAFSLGFGVFFMTMIFGTLLYAPWALNRIDSTATSAGQGSQTLLSVIGVHMLAQSLFTVWVHTRELAATFRANRDAGRARSALVEVLAVAAIVGIALAATLFVVEAIPSSLRSLDTHELIYRFFMVFYGLAFPAYVWLCMIPTRDGHAGLSGRTGKRKQIVLGVSVLLAIPFYALGFLISNEGWLGAGLGIVLAARFFLSGSRPVATPTTNHSPTTPTI